MLDDSVPHKRAKMLNGLESSQSLRDAWFNITDIVRRDTDFI